MSVQTFITSPYIWGIVAVLVLYCISVVVTGFKFNPFALARGVDQNYSVSLLQFLIFTYLMVFAYVAVYVARLVSGLTTLPDIPLNLLLLMGLSVTTATASKGIVVSYIDQGKLPAGPDPGGVIKDKYGNLALTKVQMLIWTFIAAAIYLVTVLTFIQNKVYAQPGQYALPNIDGALLVLMGASQGGYIGGKLVSQSTGPIIQRILPSPVAISGDKVSIGGGLFGNSQAGNMVVYQNKATKAMQEVPAKQFAQWDDNKIVFDIPDDMKTAGTYTVWVNANGQESNGCDITVVSSCVDFSQYPDSTKFGNPFSLDSYKFEDLRVEPVVKVSSSVVGLQFTDAGLKMDLPGPTSVVILDVVTPKSLALTAFDSSSKSVASATVPGDSAIHNMTLSGKNIVKVTITGGDDRGILVKICS